MGAGQMVQLLRPLAALVEDLCSIHSIHNSRGCDVSSSIHGYLHTHSALHTLRHTPMHVKKVFKDPEM